MVIRRARRGAVRVLTALGLKEPVKGGINRVLRAGGLPLVGRQRIFWDIERLLATPRPRPAVARGRLLFFSMRGWTSHLALETLLGEAAAQRGYEPFYFTCGGPLAACGITTFRAADPTPCDGCHNYTSLYFELLGFPRRIVRDLVSEAERAEARATVAGLADGEIDGFESDGLPLGQMIRTSSLWFLLRGSPPAEPLWSRTRRGFLEAGLQLHRAMPRLLDWAQPDRVLCLNGLFFAERILAAHTAARGIPLTSYERAFRPDTWLFRHDGAAAEFFLRPEYLAGGDRPLVPAEEDELDAYLADREAGRKDNAAYWPTLEEREESVCRELSLDPGRPVVTVFTNITWDSALQGRDAAFPDMLAWLEDTVRFFAARDDAQLVLRVHPAEQRLAGLETAEPVLAALAERMGPLPPRVRVVPALSPLSSYTLGRMSRFVMTYTSTLGLEMSLRGVPAVVAAETHYRGLGFTIDVTRRDDYSELLARLLAGPVPPPDTDAARRYAHYFFFRIQVPVPQLRTDPGEDPRLTVSSFAALGPGQSSELDCILDGLIERRPIRLDRTERPAAGYNRTA